MSLALKLKHQQRMRLNMEGKAISRAWTNYKCTKADPNQIILDTRTARFYMRDCTCGAEERLPTEALPVPAAVAPAALMATVVARLFVDPLMLLARATAADREDGRL